jgi:hypothetical protein
LIDGRKENSEEGREGEKECSVTSLGFNKK